MPSDLTRPDPPDGPALGQSRERVLAVLQNSGQPLGVGDIAAQVDLHPNTARFHLDALVEAGLATRVSEDRDVPGRPRALYAASPDSSRVGRRSYRLLAEILASYLAGHEEHPELAARQAGEAWGHFLADRPRPFQRTTAAGATDQLVDVLDSIGFAPEAVTQGRAQEILLHQCPFREVAEAHREVVCSIHLGLMQGVLAELDAPLDATRLDAFVEPGLCVARLATRSDASAPTATDGGSDKQHPDE